MSEPIVTIEIPASEYQNLLTLNEQLQEVSKQRDVLQQKCAGLVRDNALLDMLLGKQLEKIRKTGVDGEAVMAELEEMLK